jgi:hypothetical protein
MHDGIQQGRCHRASIVGAKRRTSGAVDQNIDKRVAMQRPGDSFVAMMQRDPLPRAYGWADAWARPMPPSTPARHAASPRGRARVRRRARHTAQMRVGQSLHWKASILTRPWFARSSVVRYSSSFSFVELRRTRSGRNSNGISDRTDAKRRPGGRRNYCH